MLGEYNHETANPTGCLMKIIHLPHGYWPATGGAERLTEGWSDGLVVRGHSVQVSVADLATPEGLYRFGIAPTGHADETRNGVVIHRIGLDQSYRIGGAFFRRDPYAPGAAGDRIRRRIRDRLSTALRSEIEQFDPDVVLTLPHLFENVRVVFDLHRDMGFPLVWAPLLHESDPNWPFDEVRDMLGSADALVAMTPSEATRLISGYGADPTRVHVVPPGVTVDSVPPDAIDGPPTVLYLGRVDHAKGLEILPKTMSTIWEHLPEARLVIAGAATPDSPQIQATFDSIDAPTEQSVVFHEDISEEEKQQLLRAATVLVLASVRESFGIVLLEAWASATPVVVADSPVMRDTVNDGIDGVLVSAGNDRSFAEALLRRLEDPEGSRAMGLAGYEKIHKEYSWASAAGRLEHVYEQAVSHRSQNPS